MLVYFGTYTRYGTSEGIYLYDLDLQTGQLRPIQAVGGPSDPSYLALDPSHTTLYCVDGTPDEGAVSGYSRDATSGRLTFLSRAATNGKHPSHLSVDPGGRSVLVADYAGGGISALPRSADGRLDDATCVVHHEGRGTHPERQAGPHPHMVAADPRGQVILVPDLGLDRVFAYRLDPRGPQLERLDQGGVRLPDAAGPRHLAFHPNGRFAYVVTELSSTLVACAYDAGSARLDVLQTVSLLPEGWSGESTAAAVMVHPNGRFVYASNRGHDSVATFRITPETGHVELVGHTATDGRVPRDIRVDPSGTYLLAANQDSDSVVVLRIDQSSGQPRPTGSSVTVPKPVCIVFAP